MGHSACLCGPECRGQDTAAPRVLPCDPACCLSPLSFGFFIYAMFFLANEVMHRWHLPIKCLIPLDLRNVENEFSNHFLSIC